ncbi:hypothetical protein O6H91_Y011900 [Diphasiastrum complanatum]|nr:hypothetical protein O6H91_Y011900 [Diphasiastrum complanatum]
MEKWPVNCTWIVGRERERKAAKTGETFNHEQRASQARRNQAAKSGGILLCGCGHWLDLQHTCFCKSESVLWLWAQAGLTAHLLFRGFTLSNRPPSIALNEVSEKYHSKSSYMELLYQARMQWESLGHPKRHEKGGQAPEEWKVCCMFFCMI